MQLKAPLRPPLPRSRRLLQSRQPQMAGLSRRRPRRSVCRRLFVVMPTGRLRQQRLLPRLLLKPPRQPSQRPDY